MRTQKTVAVKAGYTIEVVSWENDGDFYQTKKITVKTPEEAQAWKEMMILCNMSGIGNTLGWKKDSIKKAVEFVDSHPELFEPGDMEDEDTKLDAFSDAAQRLLGDSEDFIVRVCKSCKITYTPVDIEVDEIISF